MLAGKADKALSEQEAKKDQGERGLGMRKEVGCREELRTTQVKPHVWISQDQEWQSELCLEIILGICLYQQRWWGQPSIGFGLEKRFMPQAAGHSRLQKKKREKERKGPNVSTQFVDHLGSLGVRDQASLGLETRILWELQKPLRETSMCTKMPGSRALSKADCAAWAHTSRH